jgi:hypothetical protein
MSRTWLAFLSDERRRMRRSWLKRELKWAWPIILQITRENCNSPDQAQYNRPCLVVWFPAE